MTLKPRLNFACVLLFLAFLPISKAFSSDIEVVNVNDWGSGFSAQFAYVVTPEDVALDKVRDWRVEIGYSGGASLANAYMTGYNGTVTSGNIGPNGIYAITNEGVGYRPELDAGFRLIFNIQGQGSGFNESDFDIDFVNLTLPPTNIFAASLVSVNDWYNPSWGGGFNATFKCDVLGPDAQIGPVTDLIIDFNYSGSGTPSNAWTQSHNGTIETGFIGTNGGYAISNVNGFQPELYAGDSITFAIQVQGAGFNEQEFDISCNGGGDTTPPNQAPTALAQSLEVSEDAVLDILLDGTDPEGGALTYIVIDQTQNGSLTGTAPQLTYTPNSNFNGTDQLTFRVNDGEIYSTTATIMITVAALNDAPTVAGRSLSTLENTVLAIELSGSDIDGDSLSFEIVTEPINGALSGTAPNLSYEPTSGFSGDDSFEYRAFDGVDYSQNAMISIQVIAVNEPPIAESISASTAADTGVAITLLASDPDSTALIFSIIGQPANGTITGTAPALVYTPNTGFIGLDEFTFIANDGELDSESATVSIDVLGNTNSPPVANAGVDLTTAFGELIELDGSESSDPDGDSLTYSWVVASSPEGSQSGFTDSIANITTFFGDTAGAYRVTLTVSDGQAVSTDDTIVTVGTDPLNLPPVADIKWRQEPDGFERGTVIFLDGTESFDPEGAELTYQWRIVDQNPSDPAVLQNSTAAKAELLKVGDAFGATPPIGDYDYTFELIVSDGANVSEPLIVAVTREAFQTPRVIFDEGTESYAVSESVNLELTVFGNSILLYDWKILSKPSTSLTAFTSSNTKDTQLTLDKAGTYEIEVVVNFGQEGHEVTFRKTLKAIDPNNSAPIADATGPASIQIDQVSVLVQLDATTSSDPDGDDLKYEWYLDPASGSAAVLDDPTSPTPTFVADVRGYYYAELIVDDGQLSADIELEIFAEGIQPNQPPTAVAGPDRGAVTGENVMLSAAGSSDPDGDPLSFYWYFQTRPAGSAAALVQHESGSATFIPDLVGEYIIAVDAYDWDASSTDLIVVTVTPGNVPPVAIAEAGANSPSYPVLGSDFILDASSSFDPDGGTLSFVWKINETPDGSAATLSNADTANPTFNPDIVGRYGFTLTVSDGEASRANVIYVKAYSPNNKAPIAIISGPATASVGEEFVLDGTGAFDPDGDEIQIRGWRVVYQPAFSSASTGIRNSDSYWITVNKPGLYIFGYAVSDGLRQSETALIEVTIGGGNNQIPIANAGTDREGVVGDTIALNGSQSSDPDQDSLTYAWRIISRPSESNVELTNRSAVNPTLLIDVAGDYTIELLVSDGVSTSAPDTVIVSAIDNMLPIANVTVSPATSVVIGSTVQLDASGSTDPEGEVLTYQWSVLNAPSGSLVSNQSFSSAAVETIVLDADGSYEFSLIVSDGVQDSDIVFITVVARDPLTNNAPIAESGYNLTILENTDMALLGGLSYDADDDVLAFAWTVKEQSTGVMRAVQNASEVAAQATFIEPGEYLVQLTVSDGIASDSDSFMVKVVAEPATAPLDPGLSDRDDLVGTDQNQNNVRDDVERIIMAKQLDSGPTDALLQYGAARRTMLLDFMQSGNAKNTLVSVLNSLECIRFQFDDADVANEFTLDVAAEITNTVERYLTFSEIRKSLSGAMWVGREDFELSDSCN